MAEAPDNIEKLVTEVRRTISDNRQFLEKLLNESFEVDSEDDSEAIAAEEDIVEL